MVKRRLLVAVTFTVLGCGPTILVDPADDGSAASTSNTSTSGTGATGAGATGAGGEGGGGAEPGYTHQATIEFHHAPGPAVPGQFPFLAELGAAEVISNRKDGSLLDRAPVTEGVATLLVEDGGTITTFRSNVPAGDPMDGCSQDVGYDLVTFQVPAGVEPIRVGTPKDPVDTELVEIFVHGVAGSVFGCGSEGLPVTNNTWIECPRVGANGIQLMLGAPTGSLLDYRFVQNDALSPVNIYFDGVTLPPDQGSYAVSPASVDVTPINTAPAPFADDIAVFEASALGTSIEVSCGSIAPLSTMAIAFEVPGSAHAWAPSSGWNTGLTIDVTRIDKPVQSGDAWTVGPTPGDFLVIRSRGSVTPEEGTPCFTWHRFLSASDHSFTELELPEDLQQLIPPERATFAALQTESWSLDALEQDGYAAALADLPERNWLARVAAD